jgi:hypothetical protein
MKKQTITRNNNAKASNSNVQANNSRMKGRDRKKKQQERRHKKMGPKLEFKPFVKQQHCS